MPASCYVEHTADCDASTVFDMLDSSELLADMGSWLQPHSAELAHIAPTERSGIAPRPQQQPQKQLQLRRGQSLASAVVAKRSSKKDKQMPGNKRNRLAISRMEKELSAKLLLAQRLEADRARLQAEHQLLQECCEGFQLLRLQRGGADGCAGASEEELALLQQLQSIPCSSHSGSGKLSGGNSTSSSSSSSSMSGGSGNSTGCGSCAAASPMLVEPAGSAWGEPAAAPAAAAAGAAAGDGNDSSDVQFSPPGEVMHLYRHLISLPTCPGADTMTVQELSASYRSMVQQLAVQLHLLQQPPSCCHAFQEPPLQKMKRLMHGHLHMLTSLALLQRTEVIQQFSNVNFETGSVFEELDRAKHAWVLQQLQLSEQQTTSVVRAMRCFKRLLDPVIGERQQLQRKLAQQQDQPGAGSSSSSIDAYKQRMAMREAMLSRLVNIMRKENMLRMAAFAAVAGLLTYVQMATAAVQMTPHPAALLLLGMLALEQAEQKEQQQQQQQQCAEQK